MLFKKPVLKKKIGQILLKSGCINKGAIAVALREQENENYLRIGEILVRNLACSAANVMDALALQFGMPTVVLRDRKISVGILDYMSRELCETNHVIPFDMVDGKLVLAISDPLQDLDDLMFMINMEISPMLAPRQDIDEAIRLHYGDGKQDNLEHYGKGKKDNLEIQERPDEGAIIIKYVQETEELRKQYDELLYAVARVFPGESRHQTALRYIREAERRATSEGTLTAARIFEEGVRFGIGERTTETCAQCKPSTARRPWTELGAGADPT